MIEKAKMFVWLFGHGVTDCGGQTGIRNDSPDQRRAQTDAESVWDCFSHSCPECWWGRAGRCPTPQCQSGAVRLVRELLLDYIYSDCFSFQLISVWWVRVCSAHDMRGEWGQSSDSPPCRALDFWWWRGFQHWQLFVAGIIFATLWSCLKLPVKSTKYFELNPPLVIAFFAPWSIKQSVISLVQVQVWWSVMVLQWMSLPLRLQLVTSLPPTHQQRQQVE